MKASRSLIITTIASPNKALRAYAGECSRHGVDLIIAGDRKSPRDFSLTGADFWSLERQMESGFNVAAAIPENHYARKNTGYLAAMEKGNESILETDDDNLPYPSFWESPEKELGGRLITDRGWINVYRFFTEGEIWPRGYPLEHLGSEKLYRSEKPTLHNCTIQQGLADENPDVDAVYRLTRQLPLNFRKDLVFVLGRGSWCPFNSQNTVWFREAFPLMYLPSFCSFRMTDIWRSFVAQRIAWEYDWKIAFRSPTVYQERNVHDLMKDFRDEVPGYLHNSEIATALESLKLSPDPAKIHRNLTICYEKMADMGLVDRGELTILEKWGQDLKNLGIIP